jgi:hypothetical protein
MAVDNQFLIATILAVGLGYFALTRKPETHPAALRKELQVQNVLLQMDQADDIFHEFKIEFSKRGVNAETTPITPDELAQLNGIERNIRRIDKEVGRTAPFDRGDLERFAQRRDDLYENIDKFKSKYPQSVLQNQQDSRVSSMDLGDTVEAGAHKFLVAPQGVLGQSLSRSRAVSPSPSYASSSASLSTVRASQSPNPYATRGLYKLGPFAQVDVVHANPGSGAVLADSHSRSVSLGHEWRRSTSNLTRGFTRSRSKRAARGVSTGQQPFNNAPKSGKRVNKEKPSDGMVLKDQRGGFEAVAPQNNNNAQEDARNTNQQNAELGGDRVKEGVVLVGPVKVVPPSVPTGFDSVKGPR